MAWAPTVGIVRVELNVDNTGWFDADISSPLSGDSWVQWRAERALEPGPHVVVVRATDSTGVPQTEVPSRPAPDGATGHHTVLFDVV